MTGLLPVLTLHSLSPAARESIRNRFRTVPGCISLVVLLVTTPVAAQPEQAGSAALAEGAVIATGSDGSQRPLHDGDAVYTGDSISTGDNSYADLELDDGGRILLRPGSQFQIEQYHFDPAAHGLDGDDNATQAATATEQSQESAIFRLIKGGLRAIDGLIGKADPQDYAMQTPVATIGIRGTEYDVRYCENNCQDEAVNGVAPDNGLYTAVNQGSVGVESETGVSVVNKGGFGFLAGRRMKFRRLRAMPGALRHMALPMRFHARAERMRKLIKQRRLKRWKRHHARPSRHHENDAANGTEQNRGWRHRRRRKKDQDQTQSTNGGG